MASLTFAQMNNGQKCQFYKRRARLAILGKWTAVLTPFIAVFIAKANEYITILDSENKIKLTIGGALALIVAGIAVVKEVKKADTTKKLAPVFGWGLAFIIAFLCKSIMDDLVLILGTEFAGQVVAAGVSYYGNNASKESKFYEDEAKKDGTIIVREWKKWKKRK